MFYPSPNFCFSFNILKEYNNTFSWPVFVIFIAFQFTFLWLLTFYCSLFSRLFVIFSLSIKFFLANFFMSHSLLWSSSSFTPYKTHLHILIYLCILVKLKSVAFSQMTCCSLVLLKLTLVIKSVSFF